MEVSLYSLLGLPLLGSLILVFMPFERAADITRGKQLALFVSILTFIESIRLW
jgi:hypothetical protein